MKFFSTFFLLALFSASTAMAMPDIFKPMAIIKSATAKKSETCANFSGKWSGHCISSNGFEYDDTMAIDLRNCSELVIGDTFHMQIGGRRSVTSSDAAATYSSITDVDWSDAEKSELKFSGSWDGRLLTMATSSRGTVKAAMRFLDGNLRFEETITELELNPGQQRTSCTYSRVQ